MEVLQAEVPGGQVKESDNLKLNLKLKIETALKSLKKCNCHEDTKTPIPISIGITKNLS
jgi:hypothetical protein